jgi:hypothetical protein
MGSDYPDRRTEVCRYFWNADINWVFGKYAVEISWIRYRPANRYAPESGKKVRLEDGINQTATACVRRRSLRRHWGAILDFSRFGVSAAENLGTAHPGHDGKDPNFALKFILDTGPPDYIGMGIKFVGK